MKITVFTPTYNRAYIIENLYRSLQKQTYRDFEWIVVDDGSQDNTEELFAKIEKEDNDFPIRYLKKENGGKHRAINIGVQMAKGELFFIVDSDDKLPPSSLETIIRYAETIQGKDGFAGICGKKVHEDGKAVGTNLKEEFIDSTHLERHKHGISGDKAEVFYTEIMRKYPFPEFENEKFLTESIVWDRIAADGYKLRYFNEDVYFCDYLPDGLSAKIEKLFSANPKGYGLHLAQDIKYGKIDKNKTTLTYIMYYYQFKDRMSLSECAQSLNICTLKLLFSIIAINVKEKLKSIFK